MARYLIPMVLLVAIFAAGCQVNRDISVTRVLEMMDKGGSVVVDVRSPEEWAEAHAKGAINIPLADLETRLNELPANKNIIFICKSGKRSASAYDVAKDKGYPLKKLFIIEGGTDEWIRLGYPVSYGDNP